VVTDNVSITTEPLPITEVVESADQQELAAVVRGCFESETALYPIGGATSLDFGLPPKLAGIGLSLAKLDRIIDYPARDMTITVEAGVRMRALAAALAAENQRLPIDVPRADEATVGGVVATNFNGPRRYGHGSVRDYVIGISAVDGHGTPFKGGGRVVKNVAGYDFCKLLTGSLGTLGVITQLTMKLRPIPEELSVVACRPKDLPTAEQLLSDLVHSQTTPAAIELLSGESWQRDPALANTTDANSLNLVVAFEGTATEVGWMVEQLDREWQSRHVNMAAVIAGDEAADLMQRLAEFPAAAESPLVLKASVVPSATTKLVEAFLDVEPQCSIQAHAGNGIVIARMTRFPDGGLSRSLVGGLQTIAGAHHGNVVVLSNPAGTEMTPQSMWGGNTGPIWLMDSVKQRFDPRNILNPGRFVYRQT